MLLGLGEETGGVLGGSGGWQSAKARLCDQEVGADSPPSDELCGHFISLAICKMGPCLALPSSRVSCGERMEERQSRRWDFHSHLGGRVWGEDVYKNFLEGPLFPHLQMRVILESSRLAI